MKADQRDIQTDRDRDRETGRDRDRQKDILKKETDRKRQTVTENAHKYTRCQTGEKAKREMDAGPVKKD